jgi:uncharacterized membrane protein
MNKISRLFRHLFTTTAAGKRAFPAPALKAIQAAIAKGEKAHRAQMRLIVEPSLPVFDVLDGASSRQRARELFAHYRIWDTEENCGILIYINLADRKVEIIADRGVGRIIDAGEWQAACRTMTRDFARGEYRASVIAAIEQLNDLLRQRFPADGPNANELPNRPLII